MYSLNVPLSLPWPIIGASRPRPPSGSSSRHHSRMSRRLGRANHAERLDDHSAQGQQRHRDRGRRDRDGDQDGERGRRVEVAREDADPEELDGAGDLATDQEEYDAEGQPEEGATECLARGDPAGHPAVGADESERGEPAVAPLAADAHARGDEDADRHQQHHEDEEDEQEKDRVRLPGEPLRRLEGVDA